MKKLSSRQSLAPAALLPLLMLFCFTTPVLAPTEVLAQDQAVRVNAVLSPPSGWPLNRPYRYSIGQKEKSKLAVGTAVTVLPQNCNKVHRQNQTLYSCGGDQFKPHFYGDSLVYVVVEMR